jgi:Tfp pilus assembly protein PilF
MRPLIIALALATSLTGCETVKQGIKDIKTIWEPEAPPRAEPERSGDSLLSAGISQYEDGNYAQAQRLLQSSLTAGLSSPTSQARAHKYLAFIYCVTNRIAQCRQEFSNALSADPEFTLTPAESGHPTWGPVYRSVRQGR